MDEENTKYDQEDASAPEEPQEVVLTYISPGPQEVVERYVAPQTNDRRPTGQLRPEDRDDVHVIVYEPPAKPEKKKLSRRTWVLTACIGILSVAVVVLGVLYARSKEPKPKAGERHGFSYDFDFAEAVASSRQETTIERYPNGDGTRLRYSEEHGIPLTVQEVYARVNPCTVTVATALPGGSAIIGTGVIFTTDGYIITNAHVITGGQECFVVLDNGQSFTDVKLVGFDEEKDLAVIKINAQMLPTAEFGDSDALCVGDTVYAIGNPLGVELRGTLTDGIVSAINRDVNVDGVRMTLIQTNAALNNGNSGGPLINEYGQVIGINTMKMGSTSTVSVEGLGFAIPISSAAWMVNDLIAYGEIRGEPVLGISVLTAPVTLPTGENALRIAEIVPGGPGEKAGLEVDDCIIGADGEPINALNDLMRARRRYCAGETLTLEIDRSGERMTVNVTLEALSENGG
ncbi:MAG: trypsin-like peptidase domain-containing protein [Oscillospiraceae bacterium]|nr:trypsin-like peptidase domain-containing protein [Oscillospiraceae bacterium]